MSFGLQAGMTHRILHLRAVRQVITGSHDKMIKMWDLRKGKTMGTLTYHKKSVRAMAMHPTQFAFAAASADNIKKYQLPQVRLAACASPFLVASPCVFV